MKKSDDRKTLDGFVENYVVPYRKKISPKTTTHTSSAVAKSEFKAAAAGRIWYRFKRVLAASCIMSAPSSNFSHDQTQYSPAEWIAASSCQRSYCLGRSHSHGWASMLNLTWLLLNSKTIIALIWCWTKASVPSAQQLLVFTWIQSELSDASELNILMGVQCVSQH